MGMFISIDVKGFTVTKLESNGKWMSDIIFGPMTMDVDGRRVYSSAPGTDGKYNYKELKKYIFETYGIRLPNENELVYVGKSTGGKVYTTSYNNYLGSDLLNNTYRFIG